MSGFDWTPADSSLDPGEIVARIEAIYAAVDDGSWDYEGGDDSFSATADLLEQLPRDLRIEMSQRYEVCPMHLVDAAICADDGEVECADLR